MTLEHILIAVPTIDMRVSMEIANFFAAVHAKNMLNEKYKYSTCTFNGIVGYAAARNSIAKFFLEGTADRLWMIDDDISPSSDTCEILDVDADIVAPLMPTIKFHHDKNKNELDFDFPFVAQVYDDIDNLNTRKPPEIGNNGDVIPVDGVGFGCTVIRRHVLEDKRLWGDPHFTRRDGTKHKLPENAPPPIFAFKTMPNGVCELSEDMDFCYRARKLGYSVKLHTGVLVGHVRLVDLAYLFHIKRYYEDKLSSKPVANAIQ
jgi:hypothetical protein